MKRITEERWQELLRTGRVEIGQSWRYLVLLGMGCLGFTVVGVLFMALPIREEGFPRALIYPTFWIGLLSVLFFGVLGSRALLRAIRYRSSLVLTPHGIEEHRTRHGLRERVAHMTWQDVEWISGERVGGRWPHKGTLLVVLHLTPERYGRYLADLSPRQRRLERWNNNITGPLTIAMRRYSSGPVAMIELLQLAHQRYGRPVPPHATGPR